MATNLTSGVTATAQVLINGAFDLLGVKDPWETLEPESVNDARRRLNFLIDRWATQRLTMSSTSRFVLPLVANQMTYTIGEDVTADFNQPRPTVIDNAGLLLGNTTPPVERPIPVISDDAYAAIVVKTLSNPLFSYVYYNATSPLGQIVLWPVPNTSANSLVLYVPLALLQFPDLVTEFILPMGAADALEYNLALRLAAPYGKVAPPDVVAMAREALVDFKRLHVDPPELAVDVALQPYHRGMYNIVTDTGAG